MEIKSRVTRLAGLLCVASALQGFPVISSTNPGGIISVTQQGTYHLTGTIVDGYGEPVIGANIVEKGTTNGTVTDIDGKFELQSDRDTPVVLVFSFVGMKNKEITVGAQQQEVNVVLESEAENLDEVIVTGYQKISKERATGSFSVVTAKDYKGKMETDIMSRIEGLDRKSVV